MADYSANLTPIYRISKFLDRLVHGTDAPEPIYRIEFYLAKLAGQDVEIPEPIYRIEFYLAKLCGMDVEIPVPIYRAEFYLAKLCGEELTPPEVIYRISHWLADWAEAGGGGSYYTLTGTLPLTLPHSMPAAIRSLVRTGAMTQSPAPTPDAPVYPSINNGTVQMVHRSGLPSGYKLLEYVGSSGAAYVVTDVFLASTDVVEAEFRNNSTTGYGSLYGIFKLGESSALYANQTYYGYDESNNKVDTDIRVNTDWHSSRHDFVNGTLTIDDTTVTFPPFEFANSVQNAVLARYYNNSYGYIWKGFIRKFKVTRGGEVICDLLPAKNEQDEAGLYDLISGNFYTATSGTLVAGDEVNDYEPVVVGTPEVLTVVGNLLSRDGETTGKIITSDGTVSDNSTYCISAPFVLPAGHYTCTWQTGSGSRPFSVFAVDESGTPLPDGKLFYQQSATAGINTGEFTVEAETRVVASYRRNATDLTIYSNAQTATIPDLFAVGNYRDTVDLVAGTVTRQVGCHVFDGTESFVSLSGNRLAFVMSGTFRNRGGCVCTHFPGASGPSDTTLNTVYAWGVNLGGDKPAIWLRTTDYTASTLKALCAEQFAAGTPLIAWFVLQEPTTESLTPQALRTQDGTTVVSSSAGAVSATVEYKASEEPTAAEPANGLMMARPTGEDGGAADGS